MNLFSEEEAKTKRCCGNVGTDVGNFCRGPDCMAWRWGAMLYTDWNDETKRYGRSIKQGFCGLAGSVER